MIFRACGLMRSAGITLPGNGWPVSGSRIVLVVPLKSPLRIAAVGTLTVVPPKMALSLDPS